jgi:hypothetical protein
METPRCETPRVDREGAVDWPSSNRPRSPNAVHLARVTDNRDRLLCLDREDAREGMCALVEKRPPAYTGR